MMKPRLRQKLAEIIGIDPSALTDETELLADQWDSVVVLDLLAALDESYDVTVSMGTIMSCRNVGALMAAMRDAGAAV
ncbi:MAG TPA: acyl carrier protein [Thermoanaerobaculia bacterium]